MSGAGAWLWAGGGLRPRVEQWVSAGGFCTAGGCGRPRSVSMMCVLVLLNCVVACSAATRETSQTVRGIQSLVISLHNP